ETSSYSNLSRDTLSVNLQRTLNDIDRVKAEGQSLERLLSIMSTTRNDLQSHTALSAFGKQVENLKSSYDKLKTAWLGGTSASKDVVKDFQDFQTQFIQPQATVSPLPLDSLKHAREFSAHRPANLPESRNVPRLVVIYPNNRPTKEHYVRSFPGA